MVPRASAGIGLSFLLAAAIAGNAMAQAPTYPISERGEVDYMNGGIGREQADLMREMGAEFPVRMTFAERNQNTDEFVADVHLRITDRAGRTVLDLPGQGPIFLLQLPAGSYTVLAEHQGDVNARHFDVVPGRHDRLGFEW